MVEFKLKKIELIVVSFVSGIVCGVGAMFLKLFFPEMSGDFQLWFMFGSCVCFYCFGYAEVLHAFKEWWIKQPPFRGWSYWIDKAFRRVKTE